MGMLGMGILLGLSAAGLPADTQPAAAAVREIGTARQLFVDDWLLDGLENCRLALQHPLPREVVFRFDAPWEGSWSGYVTLLAVGGRFLMYYRGGGELTQEVTCLAESDDGVHWTRPQLGLFDFDGSTANNIVWRGAEKAYCESSCFTPFIDTRPGTPADERYKAVTQARAEGDGERRPVLVGFVSPDGVHWRRLRAAPLLTDGGFDSQNVAFWDAVQQQYVCYYRAGRDGVRSVRRSTSADFRDWTPGAWLEFGAAPAEHLYTNAIQPYARATGLYLGFPQRFVPERKTLGADAAPIDGVSDGVFMASRDGVYWTRVREAFVRPGPDPQSWGGAHGNNCPAWGLLQTGPGELSLYWAEHYGNWPNPAPLVPQLRRGTLGLDRFRAIHADAAEGRAVTRPLRFTGRRLRLNFATSAIGYVRVAVTAADGTPLPGFGADACPVLYGDEFEREVRWGGDADLAALAGREVRLVFTLCDADVFALQFCE